MQLRNVNRDSKGRTRRAPSAATSRFRLLLLRLAEAVVVSIAFAAAPETALAAFDYADESWEGTSEFLALARREIGTERVILLATLDWATLKPEDGILVLHPETNMDYEEVSAFLRAGGRLALLDDHGEGHELLSRFHIGRVGAPLRPVEMLRGTPGFAVAVPSIQQGESQEPGRHPTVVGVDKLITNYPTALRHENLNPILEIPAIGEPSATLATTGIIAKRGRLFAMGDPSAIMNLMLRYPGNRAFAQGLVRYLTADDDFGRRGGKLYLLANRFTEHGGYGGRDTLGARLRDRLKGLAELVDESRQSGLPRFVALALAALAGLGAMIWSGWVLGRRRMSLDPRYTEAPPLAAQGGVAGRAAVLAGASTHPALVALELKAAFEDKLSLLLGVTPHVVLGNLLEELERRKALSEESVGELKKVIQFFNRVELMVSASVPARVRPRDVVRTRDQIFALLAEVEQNLAESP